MRAIAVCGTKCKVDESPSIAAARGCTAGGATTTSAPSGMMIALCETALWGLRMCGGTKGALCVEQPKTSRSFYFSRDADLKSVF